MPQTSGRDDPYASIDQATAYNDLSRPVQFKNATKLLNYVSLKEGDHVLDVGCGTGLLDKELMKIVGPAGHVTAIDPDCERLKIAIDLLRGYSNVEFHICGSNAFPVKDGEAYNAVFSNMVYHWVKEHEKIESFARVFESLKPGGAFVASVPLEVPRNIRKLVDSYAKKNPEFRSAFDNAVASCFHTVTLEWIQEQLAKIGFTNITIEKGRDETFGLATAEEFVNWVQATYANTLLGQFNYRSMYEEIATDDPLLRLANGDVDTSYLSGYFVAQKPSVLG